MNHPLAPFGRRLLRVTGNEELGAYRVLRVADPEGPAPAPGQFAMLAAAERWGGGEDERPYLPRAFSYARFTAGGEAHFLLEDVGPGTHRLCELRSGEEIGVLGPLGIGFTAPTEGGRAILVGGGAGIAPLAIWQDALLRCESAAEGNSAPAPATGCALTVLLGFRDRAHAAGAALLRDAQLATDDGSVGVHGLVTELLADQLDADPQASTDQQASADPKGSADPQASARTGNELRATVYACGPAPMLEAVRALCAERSVDAQLALESGMACGFGACFGCVVPRSGGGYLRVCVEGPVVDAAELDCVEAHAGAPV